MSAVHVLDVQPVARARRHLHAVPTLPQGAPRRFGAFARRRFVVAALVVLVVCGAALGARAVAASGQPTRGVTVQVQAGETLSDVAVRTLPDLPIAEGVFRIQQANNLGSSQVSAGEELLIPGR